MQSIIMKHDAKQAMLPCYHHHEASRRLDEASQFAISVSVSPTMQAVTPRVPRPLEGMISPLRLLDCLKINYFTRDTFLPCAILRSSTPDNIQWVFCALTDIYSRLLRASHRRRLL